MHNVHMRAYVINLNSRTDRWFSVMEQSLSLGIPLVRIEALSKDEVVNEPFVTSAVAAAWYSHKKAMSIFLSTGEEYALILEDDFVLQRPWSDFEFSDYYSKNIDFLQVGYLVTTPLDLVEMKFKASADFLIKILSRIAHLQIFRKSRLKDKVLLREQVGLPFHLVANDMRPGAHAYIVSRKFALAAQQMNSPVTLSTDALFIALGWMRSFKFVRLRKSIVSHSDSVTSIEDRFFNS
jgi:GR25 family glycosyltransferase involved in LPS biosynthesis